MPRIKRYHQNILVVLTECCKFYAATLFSNRVLWSRTTCMEVNIIQKSNTSHPPRTLNVFSLVTLYTFCSFLFIKIHLLYFSCILFVSLYIFPTVCKLQYFFFLRLECILLIVDDFFWCICLSVCVLFAVDVSRYLYLLNYVFTNKPIYFYEDLFRDYCSRSREDFTVWMRNFAIVVILKMKTTFNAQLSSCLFDCEDIYIFNFQFNCI
jgi:hypothetical protein